VIAELGFHRALDFVYRGAEHDLVEFRDHLARAERTEGAAIGAGRAGRMLFCDVAEIGTARYLRFELFAKLFQNGTAISAKSF